MGEKYWAIRSDENDKGNELTAKEAGGKTHSRRVVLDTIFYS